MNKRTYRAINVQRIEQEKLLNLFSEELIIIGVDVAKTNFYAGISSSDGISKMNIKWHQIKEMNLFLNLVQSLISKGKRVEVVLEPTGTYHKVLQYHLQQLNIPIYRVDPVNAYRMSRVLDNVDSLHDPKSAVLLTRMHAQGYSDLWEERDVLQHEMRVIVDRREVYADPLQRNYGRLEACLAVFWPELTEILDFNGASLLSLLSELGGPQMVAINESKAQEILRKASSGALKPDKVQAVIDSSHKSIGVPMSDTENELLKELCSEMLRLRKRLKSLDKETEKHLSFNKAAYYMSKTVGKVTAVVLVALIGDPNCFKSAKAYEKAFGLNLKEKSSGKHQGKLKITKRGCSKARKYIFLAACRLIVSNPIVKAWYEKRTRPKQKLKAVVAVMRKLVRALYHLGHGVEFRADKLFDIRLLRYESGTKIN